MHRFTLPALLAATALPVAQSQGSVLVNDPATVYTQDFDTLSDAGHGTTISWVNDSTIDGWHAVLPSGSAPTQYSAYEGTGSIFDSLLSSGNSSDRALGSQSGTNTNPSVQYGVQLTNNTAQTLNEIILTYTGEQWRRAGNDPSDSLTVDFQVFSGVGSLSAGGYTSVSALTFDAPVPGTGSSIALDGNAAPNREVLSATISDLNWAPGDELWIRWSDTTGGNSRHGLAIDDVSIQVIPEPSSLALSMLGLACCMRRYRRRRS